MTLRLIPSVYQMMFMKNYARKQVTSLFKEKNEQLRESTIGINELFVTGLRNASKDFVGIGEERQKIVDMFGIKPAKITVYYYKNVSTEENKNYAKVLFLSSETELWNLVKNEGFTDLNETIYYFVNPLKENEIVDLDTFAQFKFILGGQSGKSTEQLKNEFNDNKDRLIQEGKIGIGIIPAFGKSTQNVGAILKDKNTKFINKLSKRGELIYYFNMKKQKVAYPLNTKLECNYVRLNKGDEFMDIFILLPYKNEAIPKENMIIYNVNRGTLLSTDLYDKEYQKKLGDIEREEKIESYISTFVKDFSKILKLLDVNIKDTSTIYTKRNIPKAGKVKIQAVRTAKYFREQEKKKKVTLNLENRLRWFIFREYDRDKGKKLTLLQTAQKIIDDLRKYKSIISKKDTEPIFFKILDELEKGDTWTKHPIANSIIVNASKEIILKREVLEENVGFLFNEKEEIDEKPVNILERARYFDLNNMLSTSEVLN